MKNARKFSFLELLSLIGKLRLIKSDTIWFNSIQDALADGKKVQLIGFGTFEVRHRSARTGRNPQTGKTIKIPATEIPAFKPGKTLKDIVKK